MWTLENIYEWFSQLCSRGPDFGYFPEPFKMFLLVSEKHRSAAQQLFGDMGVQIVPGHRFLGGYLSDDSVGCNMCLRN